LVLEKKNDEQSEKNQSDNPFGLHVALLNNLYRNL